MRFEFFVRVRGDMLLHRHCRVHGPPHTLWCVFSGHEGLRLQMRVYRIPHIYLIDLICLGTDLQRLLWRFTG